MSLTERGEMKTSKLTKSTCLIIAFSAIASLCYAETIWERRQKALNPETQPNVEQKAEEIAAPETSDYTDPFSITVPAMYGTIIDSYKGTNGKLIVHIQDAHANYEAQKNIAGIIETLINNYNLNLVLMEGKLTDRDFKYLRYRAPMEVREEIADNLLKKGDFNGVNYLDLSSSYPISIQGVEDKNLYDSNGEFLLEMDKFKDIALEYLNKMSETGQKIKEKVYNQDLLSLDKAKKDYENETIDLLGYYRILNDAIKKKGISVSEFTNFANLMKIDDMEKKIDFVKINTGAATDEQKALYKEYQDSLKNLNVSKLFKEELPAEGKVLNSISENDNQKELIKISKAISILDKMLRIKLVPEEYGYFLSNKKDFDPKKWADFLKKESDELALGLQIPENYYVITDNITTIEKFYSTATEREKTFVNKSDETIKKDNVNSAILIAGGFHTPSLTQLLSEAGYSYIVISPKVTTKTDDNLYRETLKREWDPAIK